MFEKDKEKFTLVGNIKNTGFYVIVALVTNSVYGVPGKKTTRFAAARGGFTR